MGFGGFRIFGIGFGFFGFDFRIQGVKKSDSEIHENPSVLGTVTIGLRALKTTPHTSRIFVEQSSVRESVPRGSFEFRERSESSSFEF
jgi:hypothetical protein